MNKKEEANSSVEIDVKASVIKVDHDLDKVQKFSQGKEQKTHEWEKHFLDIKKGFAVTQLLKLNLSVVPPCERFNCNESNGKGQNIDEEDHAIFDLIELGEALNGGYVGHGERTLLSYVFEFFVAKPTIYEDQRQEQERKSYDEEADKG